MFKITMKPVKTDATHSRAVVFPDQLSKQLQSVNVGYFSETGYTVTRVAGKASKPYLFDPVMLAPVTGANDIVIECSDDVNVSKSAIMKGKNKTPVLTTTTCVATPGVAGVDSYVDKNLCAEVQSTVHLRVRADAFRDAMHAIGDRSGYVDLVIPTPVPSMKCSDATEYAELVESAESLKPKIAEAIANYSRPLTDDKAHYIVQQEDGRLYCDVSHYGYERAVEIFVTDSADDMAERFHKRLKEIVFQRSSVSAPFLFLMFGDSLHTIRGYTSAGSTGRQIATRLSVLLNRIKHALKL